MCMYACIYVVRSIFFYVHVNFVVYTFTYDFVCRLELVNYTIVVEVTV